MALQLCLVKLCLTVYIICFLKHILIREFLKEMWSVDSLDLCFRMLFGCDITSEAFTGDVSRPLISRVDVFMIYCFVESDHSCTSASYNTLYRSYWQKSILLCGFFGTWEARWLRHWEVLKYRLTLDCMLLSSIKWFLCLIKLSLCTSGFAMTPRY